MPSSYDIELIEELFPFCFVLDSELALRRVATKLSGVAPEIRAGVAFESVFELVRPVIELSSSSILNHPRDIFVLNVTSSPGLVLRGQFISRVAPSGDVAVLFIGGPWITRLSQLGELGLQINDFPPHDPRGDFLVLLQTQWTNLEDMRALTEQLRSTGKALEAKSEAMQVEMVRRSALEEQLRQSQKMEALGRLAGGVAHDFNNILLAIDGYASIALSSLPEASQASSSVKLIRAASERAAALTKQLLAFTRQTPIQPTAIDIANDIREIETLLKPLMKGRIEVKISAPEGLGYAWADPTALQQIVMNLSINSFDAMPEGGTLSIDLAVATSSPGVQLAPSGFLELTIADTGVGMDEQTKSRLFEPFFTTKELGKGTGLGLSTVHGLVEQCGGSISVESELGKGTTFRVLLPRVVDKVENKPVATTTTANEGMKILLVEDDPMVRHLLTQLLLSGGYSVSVCAVPEEALALLENGLDVGLVVTDVVMPGMTGPELIRKAEAARGPLRTLYISGHTTDPMLRSGNLPARCRFLRKPFPPMDLLREVKLTLECPLG